MYIAIEKSVWLIAINMQNKSSLMLQVDVDCFYIALFSILELTHCALVASDSK